MLGIVVLRVQRLVYPNLERSYVHARLSKTSDGFRYSELFGEAVHAVQCELYEIIRLI